LLSQTVLIIGGIQYRVAIIQSSPAYTLITGFSAELESDIFCFITARCGSNVPTNGHLFFLFKYPLLKKLS